MMSATNLRVRRRAQLSAMRSRIGLYLHHAPSSIGNPIFLPKVGEEKNDHFDEMITRH
jgi:hypothetical protein